jgi:hypothetical protein
MTSRSPYRKPHGEPTAVPFVVPPRTCLPIWAGCGALERCVPSCGLSDRPCPMNVALADFHTNPCGVPQPCASGSGGSTIGAASFGDFVDALRMLKRLGLLPGDVDPNPCSVGGQNGW